MAIDPETELLIFKMRSKREEQTVITRKEAEKIAQPVSPTTILQTAPKVEVAPQQVQQAPAAAPQPSMPVIQQRAQPVQRPAPYVVPSGYYDVVETALRTQGGKAAFGTTESREETESREAARNRICTWHPWRPAYAVCEYCHRPFCFEDIVEHNRHFYCLEDVDKVAEISPETMVAYGKLSFASASLFLVSFILFVLFANAEVAAVINYANKIGFFAFVSRMSFEDVYAVFGPILAFLELVASVVIFARSRTGIITGIIIGGISITVFTYQFLNTGQLYALAIDALTVAAIFTLLHGRSIEVSGVGVPNLQTEPQFVQWSNAGRF